MTKEEILKSNLLSISSINIQKNAGERWAQFNVEDSTKAIYKAMQDFSDAQNSSLIKEVEEWQTASVELKVEFIRLHKYVSELERKVSEKESQISQLKEANNRLNYAMIEWDTTHPIEAENRELQRKIKELKEALEKAEKELENQSF